MNRTSFVLFFGMGLMVIVAPEVGAQGAITKRAQLVNQAKDTRKVLLETLDANTDRLIAQREFHEGYVTAMVDSPRIKKQETNTPLAPEMVSGRMFALIDLDKNGHLDKDEIEEALVAGVLVFKYHYIPTATEKKLLDAARKQAMKQPDIQADLDTAATLREEAATRWDDATLKKKAQEATLKATKQLHKEMIRIDPDVKPILDKMAETKP